ncbi:hypothetical protein QTP86_015152 [Hemibagrus guttatus]|nr:hypothetical protein QTP86_015152 [Hemibagrus guttatus]
MEERDGVVVMEVWRWRSGDGVVVMGEVWRWRSGDGVVVMEVWRWRRGDGVVVMEEWRWSSGDGGVEMEEWRWRRGDGVVVMEEWRWSSGDGGVEMEEWRWRRGEALNGDLHETNGPSDVYAAISSADRMQAEPESLRKWREEQLGRLEALDENSRKQEAEWKENAKQELEEWNARQEEQLAKTKVNNRAAEEAIRSEADDSSPGTEWERVARLCDFNPKSSKQAKDVSRMRSVLISLKQTPLVR